MESFIKDLNEICRRIDENTANTNDFVSSLEKNLEKYVDKAKETLKKKHLINPKPQKRFAKIAEDASENEQEEKDNEGFRVPAPPVSKVVHDVLQESCNGVTGMLRPVRSAKVSANKNLKEIPMNAKMRNENNVTIVVKTERVSVASRGSQDSLKENSIPKSSAVAIPARVEKPVAPNLSVDSVRRSASIEIIPVKQVEIDITHNDSDLMKPPPSLPPKAQNKPRNRKNNQKTEDVNPTQPLPIRVTRSKIKKEKPSIERSQSNVEASVKDNEATLREVVSDYSVLTQSKTNNNENKKQKEKKKYPMPMLIKIERTSDKKEDETFDVPINNQTVTIENNQPKSNETITLGKASEGNVVNETVTLAKNPHDSLMTEDNSEDENNDSMNVPLSKLHEKPVELPPLKLKKNEVFNPFMPSPVKQRVQAFEKHAIASMTPEKGKTASTSTASASKYNIYKAGTPSKIALYSSTSKTTPMNNAKQKYIAAVTASGSSAISSTSSATSSVKKSTTKKFTSMSHENQEDLRKIQTQAQLEEKRRQREEKQKQVQLQRELLEKQKREQTLQQQREREEKFRKNMYEKEEQKRLEAMKKKAIKENQEKKFAEEKARMLEMAAALNSKPLEIPQSASKDDSLHIKMQKQMMAEKTQALQQQQMKVEAQKKAVDKNAYSFDMLNTDDSTDDEDTVSKKRPDPPAWSKKENRKKIISLQTYVKPKVVDTLFSVQHIHVDLKAMFPSIESRKLQRNSSAVWNTPPRYSVYAKGLNN